MDVTNLEVSKDKFYADIIVEWLKTKPNGLVRDLRLALDELDITEADFYSAVQYMQSHNIVTLGD